MLSLKVTSPRWNNTVFCIQVSRPSGAHKKSAIEEERMIEPRIGFIVYGVHKDGLKDPMGQPFIDEAVVQRSKNALIKTGLKLVTHDVVIATKQEAIAAMGRMKNNEEVAAFILFFGTWVWASHLVRAIRDYPTS